MTTTTMKTRATGDPGWIPAGLERIGVEQYEAMAASGAIPEDRHIHLINGYLVRKMTQKQPHWVADELVGVALSRAVPPGRYHVAAAKPIRIPAEDSMPEPDRLVVRGTVRDYEGRAPGPADVALLVEVADTSLAGDRDYATHLYGPAGIATCWIVDVNGRRVEVYTGPVAWGYTTVMTYAEGQSVPVILDRLPVGDIAVADLLPSREALP